MGRVPPPPSLYAWRLDSERRGGHSVQEVLGYAAWEDAYDAEQAELRAQPAGVISPPGVEPRWMSKVRRWFGR
jgi:hypothetical protein